MFEFALVDVKSISSEVPISKFSQSKIDEIAQIILDTGGLIKPLVLKNTSPESYVVLEGHIEYYAAMRAKERNARKGEMVNAFIISPKSEELIMSQVHALKAANSSGKKIDGYEPTELESRLDRLELRTIERLCELDEKQAESIRLISERLRKIEESTEEKIQPLDAFNRLEVTDLSRRLISTGISQKRALLIAEAVLKERKKGPFRTLMDISARVKASRGEKLQKMLGESTLLNIVDSWL